MNGWLHRLSADGQCVKHTLLRPATEAPISSRGIGNLTATLSPIGGCVPGPAAGLYGTFR